ncbi:MAG TPA: carboxypeptidase regulatory-like domain-containing protein [Vicinamibacterales bacterium]|nr:carboxypeptidase regulatory-like domain-containing protein [Vicinamibacterales bacterium]
MHRVAGWVVGAACFLLLPTLVFAQATITGVVKDASGAVLPGVTIETSSPVLIEKTRTAVTDGTGQYRIEGLRPGTYDVVFTLPGFQTVKREGIELSGTFVATVNADLKVGAVEETITVTGETPIVDVQSVRRQTTLTNELLTTVPNARSWAAIAVLFQGITIQAGTSADVQITPQMTVFGGAGGRTNEGRMQVDGLGTGAALNGGGVSTYVADISNAQEVVTTNSGGLGEAEVGGPAMNIVPRSGGNTVKGQIYVSGVPPAWVNSNYDDDLRNRGLAAPGKLLKQWDETVGVGGPIVKDRLWYYGTYRDEGQHRSIPGVFPNLNAGDPTKWEYLPDTTKEARGAESFQLASVRLTAQVSGRNKINYHFDMQWPCNGASFTGNADACRTQSQEGAFVGSLGLGGLTATASPETAQYLQTFVQNHQVTWQSPVTNKLLLEAGVGSYHAAWGPFEMPGNPTRSLARVTELSARNSAVANFQYRSANWGEHYDNPNRWRASAAYVTGAHSMKFGYDGSYLVEDIENHGNDLNLAYTFLNGRPSSLTESLRVFRQMDRVRTTALYAQDQWTFGRMTLQGAVRYDNAWSYSPPQTIGPALINGQTFLSTPLTFDRTEGVNYKDISPRGGAAFDVFGNGRTAVKINVGKYMDPASNLNGNYSISNPIARIATTATRTWTDAGIPGVPGTAGDFEPQCDLTNNAANGECAATTATTFGTDTRTTAAIEEDLLRGWGVRPRDWQFGVSVQQQLLPRVSVEVGYLKRWLQNFTATDNLAVAPSDFTQFSMPAPSDPRLPGGGGYPVNDLYNVVQAKFGQTSNNVFRTTEQIQSFNGMLLSVSARIRDGLTLQGGVNTGKQVTDYCAVRAGLPEFTLGIAGAILSPTNPYCRVDPGFVTKMSFVGAYTIPKVDVLVAGTFRSDQGAPLRATWNAPVALVSAALGRPAAVAGTTVPIDLIEPGEVWGDRVNEIDLRVGKILRFGRWRINAGVDIFNLINSNAVLTYNQTFAPGGAWLIPQSVLTPRFVKLSAQIDF